jgi:DNA repair ATPase RecN
MKKVKDKKEKMYKSGEVVSMLESINDGIQVISEQYGEMLKKFDKVDTRFDKIEARLDKIEARLDKIEFDVDAIKSELLKIKRELQKKISTEEFEKLEKRVFKLEKLVMAG